MPGYEDLTPDQIIYIANLIVICIFIYCITMLLRTVVTWKISKNVEHLELMIEKKYDDGIKKPSLFEGLKSWWDKRKTDKQQKELLKPSYKVPRRLRD